MLEPLKRWSPPALNALNWGLMFGSVLLCAMAMPVSLPSMELTGVGPNWLLIWVVTWSVKRNILQGAAAGICLGWIQDGLTAPQPTHAIALGLVGILTAALQKPKFIAEDFISVALIVFGMAAIAETVTAVQVSLVSDRPLQEIWLHQRQIALSSAILSSLWAPVVYYPLNSWWQFLHQIEQ
ncbi:MAG: rod shape-determining protein MreD [Aphanocapsa sp. GSE-SYN-MK-11-07L]|nr:rod shape-determining protein MreD [Aphanocapsa sp. GSE-SYN-MK-11-07L]